MAGGLKMLQVKVVDVAKCRYILSQTSKSLVCAHLQHDTDWVPHARHMMTFFDWKPTPKA